MAVVALSLRNDEVANCLECFGADRTDDLRKLIAHEIEAEELKQSASSRQRNEARHQGSKSLALDLSNSDREDLDDLVMRAASSFR